jgi:hypothetical protein
MSNTTFQWQVSQMERQTADGAVVTVHYTVEASDTAYRASAYGSIGLEQPDPETMIPYADLTPEVVIGWVKEKLGGADKVAEIEAALQAQLDEQHAPTKAQGLPW